MQLSLFDQGVPAPSCSPGSRTVPTPVTPRSDLKAAFCDWEEALCWMAERYEHLHLWVLKRNLRILNELNTCDEERADILTWINAPVDQHEWLRPFSFQACLMLYDPRCNVEAAQASLRQLNQRVLQRQRERAV